MYCRVTRSAHDQFVKQCDDCSQPRLSAYEPGITMQHAINKLDHFFAMRRQLVDRLIPPASELAAAIVFRTNQ